MAEIVKECIVCVYVYCLIVPKDIMGQDGSRQSLKHNVEMCLLSTNNKQVCLQKSRLEAKACV